MFVVGVAVVGAVGGGVYVGEVGAVDVAVVLFSSCFSTTALLT